MAASAAAAAAAAIAAAAAAAASAASAAAFANASAASVVTVRNSNEKRFHSYEDPKIFNPRDRFAEIGLLPLTSSSGILAVAAATAEAIASKLPLLTNSRCSRPIFSSQRSNTLMSSSPTKLIREISSGCKQKECFLKSRFE